MTNLQRNRQLIRELRQQGLISRWFCFRTEVQMYLEELTDRPINYIIIALAISFTLQTILLLVLR